MEDDTFAPLTTVFFSQMIDIFYYIAKRSPGQTLPTVFHLDHVKYLCVSCKLATVQADP